jgi:hypothetical protein
MYLPKTKYKAGLFTSDSTLLVESTREVYIGPYFETFKGEVYAGTSPLGKNIQKLVKVDTSPELVDSYLTPGEYDVVKQDVEAYNLRVTEPVQMYYPVPSEENYSKGELLRYFLRDKTIGRILEVRKDVYESISKKEIKYYYPKYELLALSWSLRNVGSNRTVIQLAEKRLPGISSYLKDPSQFVK